MPTPQSMDGPNGYSDICFDCGKKYGLTPEGGFGMWTAKCGICGETIGVANALHDFGMSEAEVMSAREMERPNEKS